MADDDNGIPPIRFGPPDPPGMVDRVPAPVEQRLSTLLAAGGLAGAAMLVVVIVAAVIAYRGDRDTDALATLILAVGGFVVVALVILGAWVRDAVLRHFRALRANQDVFLDRFQWMPDQLLKGMRGEREQAYMDGYDAGAAGNERRPPR